MAGYNVGEGFVFDVDVLLESHENGKMRCGRFIQVSRAN